MKSAIFATALFVAAVSADFTVNTPSNVVECQPLQISWSGGDGDTYLSVLPGSDPSGTALIDFGEQTSPFTWSAVNITSGTSIGLTVRDSTGALAQSAAFTVNSGSSTSCLTSSGSSSASSGSSTTGSTTTGSSSGSSAASSTSASAAATSSSASSASSSASAASGSSTSSKASSSGSSSSTATSAASSSTSSSAAAPTLAAQYGAAGVLGAVAAAVLL